MSYSWRSRSSSSRARTPAAPLGAAGRLRDRAAARALRLARPELLGVMALAGTLDLWALGRNGWANTYYSAAVRSMSSSWHDFLFASLDRSGVMTVDKPPLALWVQALSVRIFGYHPLSVLVPEALMGVAAVALLYDLVRRRFGRVGGFIAALALALTPITVAISRHNNPDALLVLCSVAALWFTVKGLESGRARWLVLAAVSVGLGFETKMGVALTVVPGIALAWLVTSPAGRGRMHALRQLLGAGGALLLTAGAWPALVELTPAADRPWVSGTSDNSVLSLIFGYNGLGRVSGQTGGPAGGGGVMFGGTSGPLRLLNAALGGQASWLLGFALVSALAIAAASRLRRSDARTGWVIAVGGALVVTALLFSLAGGIFHPYYVSQLAPLVAALVGAGAALVIRGGSFARFAGPPAIGAGVVTELVVRSRYPGQLTWLAPVLIALCTLAILALLLLRGRLARTAAIGGAVGALLIAPAIWAVDTLGYAASATFPSGGPASALSAGGGPGGGFGGGARGPGGGAPGPGGPPPGAQAPQGGAIPSRPPQQLFGGPGAGVPPNGAPFGSFPRARGGGAPGGFGGTGSLTAVLSYIRTHGGGTLAVESQSSAASTIVAGDAAVAGIGGFSGRESNVSVSWLAQEVGSGHIRWVLAEEGSAGPALPGDTRSGSRLALSAAKAACRRVPLSKGATAATAGSSGSSGSQSVVYDCLGRSAAIEAAA